jgi:hypothetical protein
MMELAMEDVDARLAAVEKRSESVLQLLQQAVSALFSQRERIDALEGRLKAHTVVTAAILQLARRSDPETFSAIMALLEMSERDLERTQEDAAAVSELREILAVLRASAEAQRP